MKEITLQVTPISCVGCENSIKQAFKSEDRIILVEPSHKTKTVKIKYDETQIDENKIIKILKENGREVKK
ncbi:MAG TPA: heavy-metal-associated domain-containing protein [Elusimicrobiales bacterium]|nr:heavy-metal-associated domain-containing protein [Elusimicrobiales bacterium]HOL63056.1 heavy-metal-associated domain-containing protein [Elusimicrobiales bacterium]HPO95335.1 heavy-metal-associated domain-containing protein [Elusimicrobiales bacterium]